MTVIYNAAIESKVKKCIKSCRIEEYTKIPRIQGVGKTSGPRLNTHVWPGVNHALKIACKDTKKDELIKKLKEFKKENAREGVKVFVQPLEEII
ncbi:MAG: PG0541 family transporter-associated protein [Elusimicrobiota bacterium]